MASTDLIYRFLGLDAGAGAQFDRMGAKTAALGKTSSVAMGAVKSLGIAAGVTAAVISVEAVKAAASFQTALARIHTQADASNKTVGVLKQGILGMTAAVATAPTELATAAFHIASVGQKSLTAAQQLQILKTAAQGAKLGGADLVDVTNALDAAVVSGIRGVHNYSQAMGVLNATVGAGDMTMQNLAEAFGPLGAVLKGYNVNIRQAGAALAVFGDNNLRGAEAGTALRMAVQSLAVPVKGGQDLLKSWGVASGNLADQLRHGGLTSALDTLYGLMRKNGITGREVGDVLTQAFGKRAGIGLATLIGELDRYHNKLGEVSKGAHGFAASWAGYTKTFSYNFDRMKAATQRLLIELGDKLMPVATALVNWVTKSFLPAAEKMAKRVGSDLAPSFRALAGTMKNNASGLKDFATILSDVGKIAGFVTERYFKDVVLVLRLWIVEAGLVGKAFRALADFFTGAFVRAVGGLVSFWANAMKGLADAAMSFFSFFVNAAVKALGWLPFGIGSAVKKGAAAFASFRTDVDSVLTGIAVDASVWGQAAGAGWAAGFRGGASGKATTNPDDFAQGAKLARSAAAGHHAAPKPTVPSGVFTFPGGAGVTLPSTGGGGGGGGGGGSSAATALHTTAAKLTAALAKGLIDGWQGFALTVRDSLSVGTRHLLDQLGKQFQAIQDRMKKLVADARTTLRNAMKDERQYVQQMMGDAALSNTPMVASGYLANGGQRLQNIGVFLGSQARNYALFDRLLRRLGHSGLSKGLVNQIAAMGPTQGIQYAQQILSGGAGSIAQLNAYQRQISTSAQRLGHDRYGAQIAADRKELRHQTRLQERMEHHLSHLARDVGREVARTLGPAVGHLTGKQTGLSNHDAREIEKVLRRLNRQLGKS